MGTMTTRDIRTACNRWHRASRGGMSNQEVGENTFFIPRAVLSPTSWLLIPTPACGRRRVGGPRLSKPRVSSCRLRNFVTSCWTVTAVKTKGSVSTKLRELRHFAFSWRQPCRVTC